jgi:hypothetical protein
MSFLEQKDSLLSNFAFPCLTGEFKLTFFVYIEFNYINVYTFIIEVSSKLFYCILERFFLDFHEKATPLLLLKPPPYI